MIELAKQLFPICRSITGEGVRETLAILQQQLPDLTIESIASGSRAFDWTVPKEWHVSEAYIENENGERILDFANNNLHLVGYSTPVDKIMTLEELRLHLHSLPQQPNAIPYVTSYYREYWGFCLTHQQLLSLKEEKYHVVIKSQLFDGELNYGELLIAGETSDEILLSTYICHPSMANNEISGPVVTSYLCQWLQSLPTRKYSYRIVFIPETIGSIVYLSRQLTHLKQHVKAGYVITCIGDERCYSYLPSRAGNTLADIAAIHVLKHLDENFKQYSWLDRGSDERQYCAPGIDLPIASIMRSKYAEYPEYHTSLDNFDLVTENGLQGGLTALKKALFIIENNCTPQVTVLGEPQLGKRGLYPNLSTLDTAKTVAAMMDMLSYCDGQHDLLSIAEKINQPFEVLYPILQTFIKAELVKIIDESS